MATENFKVIVVGGGPAGLIAAHTLSQAGIDFVILEQRDDVTIDIGACVVLGPQNLRVVHQLGLFEKLMKIGGELVKSKGFRVDGYEYKSSTELQTLKDNHGIPLVAFHRAQLVQALYEGLSDDAKSRYLTRRKVIEISSYDESVAVTCSDGSTYQGSMVLGADGVHSVTRRIMRKLAIEEDPKREWDEETPFVSEYKCMWCSFPRPSAPKVSYETTHKDLSVMYITGPERGWILSYEKLPEPTKERHDYSEKDIEAFAEKIAEFPVNETLKVKDVFSTRITAGMSDLQEGIAKHWSWGRIVLAGDSAHRYTPNAGLGLNNGIQDVVVLSNLLRAAVHEAPGRDLDSKAIGEIFASYREKRLPAVQKDFDKSALVTRLHAWANWIYYLLNRFILPRSFVANYMVNHATSPTFRKGFVLDYVRATELPAGKFAWENPIPSPS